MTDISLKQSVTDAIRFWERLRLVYNAALVCIVLAAIAWHWPKSQAAINFESAKGLFMLAVLANVLYCAAYPVDLLAQASEFREAWRRYRGWLFAIGLLFASALAQTLAFGNFSGAS